MTLEGALLRVARRGYELVDFEPDIDDGYDTGEPHTRYTVTVRSKREPDITGSGEGSTAVEAILEALLEAVGLELGRCRLSLERHKAGLDPATGKRAVEETEPDRQAAMEPATTNWRCARCGATGIPECRLCRECGKRFCLKCSTVFSDNKTGSLFSVCLSCVVERWASVGFKSEATARGFLLGLAEGRTTSA